MKIIIHHEPFDIENIIQDLKSGAVIYPETVTITREKSLKKSIEERFEYRGTECIVDHLEQGGYISEIVFVNREVYQTVPTLN